MTPEEMTPEEMTPEEMTPEEMTPEEMTSKERRYMDKPSHSRLQSKELTIWSHRSSAFCESCWRTIPLRCSGIGRIFCSSSTITRMAANPPRGAKECGLWMVRSLIKSQCSLQWVQQYGQKRVHFHSNLGNHPDSPVHQLSRARLYKWRSQRPSDGSLVEVCTKYVFLISRFPPLRLLTSQGPSIVSSPSHLGWRSKHHDYCFHCE